MHTYDKMREKKQLCNEAMAEITANETRKIRGIWMNFFCCRIE